jgi:hypothetical protein
MSGNRANTAAVNRRSTSGPGQGQMQGGQQQMQGQMQGGRPGQGQQQGRSNQGQQQGGRPGQGQQQGQGRSNQGQQQPTQPPQMSVSDAIGLISIRLGRVETFIQQMPPLDQINMNVSSDENSIIGENMRVVDEAVFTNIVARLEKIEKSKVPVQTTTSEPLTQVTTQVIQQVLSEETTHAIDVLKIEMLQVKELLLSLQSYTMQTNQKLVEMIFNNDVDYEDENAHLIINNDDNTDFDNQEGDDAEILVSNIDFSNIELNINI